MMRHLIVGRKGAKPVPESRFYLADDIRLEADGKVSAIGLYADLAVVALMRPGQPEPSEATPLVFDGFTCLFSISGLAGKHKVAVEYHDDGGMLRALGEQVLPIDQEIDFLDPARSANLLLRLRPYFTTAFGMKRVTLSIDGVKKEFTFEVRRGELPSSTVAAPSPAKVPARRAKKSRETA
jgi:hypothetical protein